MQATPGGQGNFLGSRPRDDRHSPSSGRPLVRQMIPAELPATLVERLPTCGQDARTTFHYVVQEANPLRIESAQFDAAGDNLNPRGQGRRAQAALIPMSPVPHLVEGLLQNRPKP
jgi:hypothetical protein